MKRGFIKKCKRVFDFFSDLENDLEYGTIDFPLGNFLDYYPCLEKIEGKLKEEVADELWDYRAAVFAVGFTIGQLVQVTYPEIESNIQTITKVIKEENLLPYLPRKKAERG